MDRCTCTTTGLGRHMSICLWVVHTYSTDQMLAFESVGRVVSNVECGWSTYNLLFHDIFSEFYRHMINPVYFCACLTAVSTDTSTKWISMYQSMGSLGHFVVQCPIHIFGFVDVPGMSSSCSSVVARIHRTRPAPARLKLLEMAGSVTLQGRSIPKFGWGLRRWLRIPWSVPERIQNDPNGLFQNILCKVHGNTTGTKLSLWI